MNKNRKKLYIIIATVVLIASVLVLTVGLTRGLWSADFNQTGDNIINPGCLDITFKDNTEGVKLQNSFPITDTAGEGLEGYSFTLTNTCTIAASVNIVLNVLKTNTIEDDSIKYAVSGDKTVSPQLLSSADSTTVVKNTTDTHDYDEARILFTDYLAPASSKGGKDGTSKTYNLKVWLADEADVDENLISSFDGRLTVVTNAIDNKLVTAILNSNQLQTKRPNFYLGSPNCDTYENCVPVENGTGLFAEQDDDGTSYYFRGAVNSNNVTFADMNWKIIRINGDGSIRLILTGGEGPGQSEFNKDYNYDDDKYIGYTYDNTSACTKSNPCISDFNSSSFQKQGGMGTDSTVKSTLEKWYVDKLASHDEKIALTTYCNDTSRTLKNGYVSYSSSYRILGSAPILTCPNPLDTDGSEIKYGGVYKLKIGLLTADEMKMAGAATDYPNYASSDFYLSNLSGWSMTPRNGGNMQFISVYLNDPYNYVQYPSNTIPVINLKPDVTFKGSGTASDPYVIQ